MSAPPRFPFSVIVEFSVRFSRFPRIPRSCLAFWRISHSFAGGFFFSATAIRFGHYSLQPHPSLFFFFHCALNFVIAFSLFIFVVSRGVLLHLERVPLWINNISVDCGFTCLAKANGSANVKTWKCRRESQCEVENFNSHASWWV